MQNSDLLHCTAQVAVQDPQMVQQAAVAQYGAPDLALQQQMAAQGPLPGRLLAYLGQGGLDQS